MAEAPKDVGDDETMECTENPSGGLQQSIGTFDSISIPGYPKLADLMAQYNQAAIFRRFRSLNLFNLMRLQAELVELEDRLKEVFKINEKGRNQFLLQDFFEMSNSDDDELRELLLKIDVTLKDYNKTLSEVAQVASFKSPHKAELHFMHTWLKGLESGEGQSFLRGSERMTWNARDLDEYFVLGAERSEADAATGRTVDWLITTYNHIIGRKIKRNANAKLGVIQYSGLKTTAKFIITLLSSMLPALSVLGLYFEKQLLNRIGIMISMTFVFAAALTFGTSAKRIEIFAATAAFAAVEVVFIGSTDIGNGTQPG